MSTEYEIAKLSGPTNAGHRLELWEHSSLLDLAIEKAGSTVAVLGDMRPDEVVRAAIQMMKVAEYQIGMDAFRDAVRAAIAEDPYTIGPLCRDVGAVAAGEV